MLMRLKSGFAKVVSGHKHIVRVSKSASSAVAVLSRYADEMKLGRREVEAGVMQE